MPGRAYQRIGDIARSVEDMVSRGERLAAVAGRMTVVGQEVYA